MIRPPVARDRPRARSGDRACRLALTAPLVALLRAGGAARVAAVTRSTARRGSARTARRSRSTSCARWSHGAEFTGAGLAIQEGDDRHHAGRRASCAATRSTSCPNLWNVLRGEMSIVGPRPTMPVQVDAVHRAPARPARGQARASPGWAQVNGRASLPWSERIELDLWYVEHRSLALDLRILGAHACAMVLSGQGLYKGETGGWDGARARRRRPADRRRQALRHRLGFAQHATVVAADPNPLAPAQYAAHYRACGAADRRPRLRPGAARPVRASSASGRSCR